MEASREEAASNALKPLLQLGLDRSNKLKSFEESQVSLQGKLWTYFALLISTKFLFTKITAQVVFLRF